MANTSLKLGFLAVLLLIATGLPHVMSDLPPCVTEADCLTPCGSPSKCTGQRQDGTPGCICSAKQVTKGDDMPPCVTETDCATPCGGKGTCTGQRKDGTPGCVCSANSKSTASTPAPAQTPAKTTDLSPCVTEADCSEPCGGKGLCTGQRKDGTPGCVCSANSKSTVSTPAPAQTPAKTTDLSPCVTEADCSEPCGGKGLCTGQRKDGTPGCVCSANSKSTVQTPAVSNSKSTVQTPVAANSKSTVQTPVAANSKSSVPTPAPAKTTDLSPCVTESDCSTPCGGKGLCTGQRKDGTPGCVCSANSKSSVSTPAPAQTPVSTGELSPCVTESDCTAPCGGKGLCTGQRKDGTPGCVCSANSKSTVSTPAPAQDSANTGELSPCVTESDCTGPCGGKGVCTGQRKDGTPGCICQSDAAKNSSSNASGKKKSGKKHKKSKTEKKGKHSSHDLPPCVTEDDCLVPCGRKAPCSGERKDGTPGCECKSHAKLH